MPTYTRNGYAVVTSLGSCLALAGTFVALRFGVRLRKKRAPLVSDYLVLLAFLVFIPYAVVQLIMVGNEWGSIEPLEVKSFDPLVLIFHYTIILELLLGVIITLAKVSILSFYRQVFIDPLFRKATWVIGGICIAWFIATFFVLIFQCSPVTAAWTLTKLIMGAKCFSLPDIILGYEITNIVVDIMILALPVREIARLQMTRTRKVTVTIVFLLGGFVTITSAVRIHFTRPVAQLGPTVLVNFTQTTVWTNIQIGSAIICACLPTLPPLLPDSFYEKIASASSRFAAFIASGSFFRSSKEQEKDEESVLTR